MKQKYQLILDAVANSVLQDNIEVAALQKQIDGFKALTAPVVFDALETTPWLVDTSNAGSAPGTVAVATQATPGINSAWVHIAPQGKWANAYFYRKLGAQPLKKKFTYEISLFFGQPADSLASQAIEIDTQQSIAGWCFNPAWQFEFANNRFRVWNRDAHEKGLPEQWTATGKPCMRWTAGQWVKIVAEMHRDDNTVYNDYIRVNDVLIPVNMSFPAVQLGLPDMLNIGLQLDGDKAGAAYGVYLDRLRFTAA